MSRGFQLLVFDWDGTLMDSQARIVASMQAAMAQAQLPPRSPEAIREIIGLGMVEAVAALYPDDPQTAVGRLIPAYRRQFLELNPEPEVLFPGAAETLVHLADAGYLLAVATGKSRRGLDRVLADTGVGALIHGSRCADETASKPHPQMLKELVDEFGVCPAEAIMIGDTEFDLQMARNAGTAALAVSYGNHPRERLLSLKPLGCLDRIDALPAWLNCNLDEA